MPSNAGNRTIPLFGGRQERHTWRQLRLSAGIAALLRDPPRRIEIVKAIARAKQARLSVYTLAASYADRPDDRFPEQLSKTRMRGGWGASCIRLEVSLGPLRIKRRISMTPSAAIVSIILIVQSQRLTDPSGWQLAERFQLL